MNAHSESSPIHYLPTDNCVGNGRRKESLPNNPVEKTPEIKALEAFRNEEAMNFVEESLLKKTALFFPNHVHEARDMVQNIFDLVSIKARMSNIIDNGNLKDNFTNIHNEILLSNSWFPQAYDLYRKERAHKDFVLIEPYMKKGKGKVLDFGSGMGHLSAELSEEGYVVTSADVIDYTINKDLKEDVKKAFKKMSSPTDIDFSGEHFDTIIIWQVLHHINEGDLFTILSKLSEIGDRLIINEDIYGSGEKVQGFAQSISEQKELARYTTLPEKDQVAILRIIDKIANDVLGLSEDEMNIPLRFKPVDQWESIVSDAGFDIVNIWSVGIKEYKWHPDPQILVIADSKKNKS